MMLFVTWLKGNWAYRLGKLLIFWYVKLVYGLRVDNAEKVPLDGGLVIVGNHISTFDPPIIGISTPRAIHFMAKKELFAGGSLRADFFARILRLVLSFPVDREGNAMHAIKEALRRLKFDVAIGIFIQGTRNRKDTQAFDGAAFIAQRAGVALQPVAIWREGRSFRVSFADPIYPQGKDREEAKALTLELMKRINMLLPEGEIEEKTPA